LKKDPAPEPHIFIIRGGANNPNNNKKENKKKFLLLRGLRCCGRRRTD
jgi:hypothetical protein